MGTFPGTATRILGQGSFKSTGLAGLGRTPALRQCPEVANETTTQNRASLKRLITRDQLYHTLIFVSVLPALFLSLFLSLSKKVGAGESTQERMLYITHYWRTKNQNHHEVSPLPGQNGHPQGTTDSESGEGVKKVEGAYPALGNVNW